MFGLCTSGTKAVGFRKMAVFSKFRDQLSAAISGKVSPQGAIAVAGVAAIAWKLMKLREATAKKKRSVVVDSFNVMSKK